jgi:uncharacterized protein with HEPN domain
MPKREPDLLLEDIRAALVRIERYTSGIGREQFLSDEKTIDAVARNLEIIGEAVRLLPNDFKLKHNDIPWAQIGGLRNRIVHDYFGLDLEIIWQVLQTSLRDLKTRLSAIDF